ncbi:hypothetical protein K504DRAFT_7062 [Pleomassaria siparia CBS 279.74]|uniref:Uncharacterized protein n=1 Tax=Pleomassaria siparia CBS 279.74 TaxID=1314801 RepID=A0A6G1KP03_9PLEO|nr:hypothetical protein K504DRAFT_7062 [Pleomassaria siparia CBS 279.74]
MSSSVTVAMGVSSCTTLVASLPAGPVDVTLKEKSVYEIKRGKSTCLYSVCTRKGAAASQTVVRGMIGYHGVRLLGDCKMWWMRFCLLVRRMGKTTHRNMAKLVFG